MGERKHEPTSICVGFASGNGNDVIFKADSGFISHHLKSDTAFNFLFRFLHLIPKLDLLS
jgi:hypothetical protein